MFRNRGSTSGSDAWLRRALSCLLLVGAGAIGGMALGGFAVGDSLYSSVPDGAPYADLSSNPDAVGADSLPLPSCYDCADGYASAARAYAARRNHGPGAFDPPEAVTIEYAPSLPVDDGYRYGGTFAESSPPLPSAAVTPHEVGDSKLLILSPDAVPVAPPAAPIAIPAAN